MKLDHTPPGSLTDSAVHQKKEVLHLATLYKKKNHIWEYDTNTKFLKRYDPSRIVSKSIKMADRNLPRINDKIVEKAPTKEECLYLQALNRKNAIKQFSKLGYIVLEEGKKCQ